MITIAFKYLLAAKGALFLVFFMKHIVKSFTLVSQQRYASKIPINIGLRASSTSTDTRVNRVAIIGGGYAGLACGFKYASLGVTSVHVFDTEDGPGKGGASSVSAGLMHPLAPRGNIIWGGIEGFSSTKSIMDSILEKLDRKVYDCDTVLIRPLYSEKDFKSFSKAADRHPEWITIIDDLEAYSNITGVDYSRAMTDQDTGTESIESPTPGKDYKGAAIIRNALLVDSPLYLESLWDLTRLQCSDAQWINKQMSSVQDVSRLSSQYDVVVLACGADIKRLWTSSVTGATPSPVPSYNEDTTEDGSNVVSPLHVKLVRGQNIILTSSPSADTDNTKAFASSLKSAVLCGEYLIPRIGRGGNTRGAESILCGATHEHLTDEQALDPAQTARRCPPDLHHALQLLRARMQYLFPALSTALHRDPDPAIANEATIEEPPSYAVSMTAVAGVRVVGVRNHLGRLPLVGRFPLPDQSGSSAGSNSNSNSNGDKRWNSDTAGSSDGGMGGRDNLWMITGFGSRGLLHHSLVADMLVSASMADDDSLIPVGIRHVIAGAATITRPRTLKQ